MNRAIQLTSVLYQKIGIPNHILVPSLKMGKGTTTARMYQTIIPFAVKYNLAINTYYLEKDFTRIAIDIQKKKGTILLVWEHKAIIKIVKALGIKENVSWDDNDFDSIWIITYANGVPKLTREKENITPTTNCQ